MNPTLDALSNPHDWVPVVSLALLIIVLTFFKNSLGEDFKKMKISTAESAKSIFDSTAKTNEELNKHAKQMIEITANLNIVKFELLAQIEALREFAAKMARELKDLDHKLGIRIERLEYKLDLVLAIEDKLNEMHGSLETVGTEQEEFRLIAKTNRDGLLKLKEVLVHHNKEIQELKGKK